MFSDVFEPASPNTILKKQTCKELSEAKIYRALAGDSVQQVIPKFYKEIERNNEGKQCRLKVLSCMAIMSVCTNLFVIIINILNII